MSKNYQRGLAICGLLAVVALVGGLVQMDAVHHVAGGAGFVAMAVVIGYGSGARDPSSLKAIDGINAAAEERRINSLISIANGDSIGSLYMIGEVPADAIMNPLGSIICTAITGVSSVSIGFAYPNGGAMILATALVNGQTLASAATVALNAATGSGVATPANMKKRAWELAGLSANPGGNLAVWMTLNAAATAAGTVWSNLSYSKGA